MSLDRQVAAPPIGRRGDRCAWGLFAVAEVWREVDEALDEVCVALCPDDLRGCVSHDSALRRELALPRGNGGLGIPHVATEAPIMAAGG